MAALWLTNYRHEVIWYCYANPRMVYARDGHGIDVGGIITRFAENHILHLRYLSDTN